MFVRVLSDVMDIPKSLVTEAEEAIKIKLKPILDQAQVQLMYYHTYFVKNCSKIN